MAFYRKRVDETKREDVRYVFSYLKRENRKCAKTRYMSDYKIYSKVSEILHLSLSNVSHILQNINGDTCEKKKRRYKNYIDEFDKDLIKNTVHFFSIGTNSSLQQT